MMTPQANGTKLMKQRKNITKDFLKPENCNKSMCKTCIFGDTPVQLSPQRVIEIHTYLIKFEAVHICHTTDRVCYGALELQAKVLFALGGISSPTIESLLNEAEKFIKDDTNNDRKPQH